MKRWLVIALLLSAGGAWGQSHADPQQFAAMWEAATDITHGLQHFFDPGGTGEDKDQITGMTPVESGSVKTDSNGWMFEGGAWKFWTLASPISNASSYAVAVWVKPNKTAMDSQTFGGWILADRNPINTGWDFQLWYAANNAWFFQARDKVNSISYSASSANVEHDTWTHLFAVADYDALELRLYVNGVLEQATSVPSAAAESVFSNVSTQTRIGMSSWDISVNLQYRGVMDKLRFYNGYAPDEAFITRVYQADGEAKGILP